MSHLRVREQDYWVILTQQVQWSMYSYHNSHELQTCTAAVAKRKKKLRGLQLPNFSENPNNVRKWVGGVNACSDWKCPTLHNFGQFSKVQWLSRSVLLEVKNLCLLSISRSFLLLEARGRWGLRINVDLPWPAQSIRPFSLPWQVSCGRFTCQRH